MDLHTVQSLPLCSEIFRVASCMLYRMALQARQCEHTVRAGIDWHTYVQHGFRKAGHLRCRLTLHRRCSSSRGLLVISDSSRPALHH